MLKKGRGKIGLGSLVPHRPANSHLQGTFTSQPQRVCIRNASLLQPLVTSGLGVGINGSQLKVFIRKYCQPENSWCQVMHIFFSFVLYLFSLGMVFKRILEFSALIGFFLSFFLFLFSVFLFCFAFFSGSPLFHGVNPYRRLSESYYSVHRKSLLSENIE